MPMIIARVLAPPLAKIALATSAISVASVGGYVAYQRSQHAPPSAFEQVQGQGQRLIVSEFGEYSDTIVAVDPNDVSAARTTIATIDHAAGYGIFPTLSPDGKAIAYTALAADDDKPSSGSRAQAIVLDVGGDPKLLADDVDLLVPPVWAPDSKSIVARRNTPEQDGAGTFELLLLGRDGSRASITTWHSAAVFPIAFAPDGTTLYFATLNAAGTDLYRVAPDGSDEAKIAHLSDEIARDWKLSPDGSRMAYSIAQSGDTPGVVTETLDLATGEASAPLALDATAGGSLQGQFSPAWSNENELTVSTLKPEGGGDAVQVNGAGDVSTLTDNSDAIDLPLAWSPDGSKLAVRSVKGQNITDATESHVELVDGGGRRERISDNADVLIVGWLD